MKKLAFVFPGQGSQSVGMLADLATHPIVIDYIRRVSDVLSQDIFRLIQEGPEEQLNSTVNTQPVMLASAYAFFKVWESEGGVMPVIMAGHSLGEYTAATAAGVFSFEDAIKVVRFRAQAMQEAVPAGVGGMAAVLNLDINVIRDICQKSSMPGSVVEPVNLNTLEQTVIAGHQSAIERVSPILKEAGAKRVISLPVSAPFHSSLMKPAADRLGQFLSQISMNRPHIPFVNNIDVQEESSAEKIRDAFVRQAYGPVRWVELIRYLESFGVTDVVECGPGKVLSGLITKLTSGKMRVFSINHKDSLSSAMEALTGI